MNYVIIGNGTAAVGAVEGIRRTDPVGSITLIAAEPHHTYGRPLISYYLEGRTDRARMKYRPDDFYEKNGVTALLGQTVTTLDAAAHTVSLADGRVIPYDRLLVATGSSPFVLPFAGLDTVPAYHTFLTLDDALGLEKAVRPDSRVFIVGAGLIGLKCAEGLAARVGSITVTDLSPRVLSSILDEDCAGMVQAQLEGHGIAFRLGDSVDHFDGSTAHMKSGDTVPFDVLVIAMGVRPNTALVKEAGGEVGRGIVIDESGRTTLPDVYAAGDCAEGMDASTGSRRILAILPNAYRQGECAGVNMAGGARTLTDAIPMNAIGFFGLHLVSAGSYDGEVYEERGDGTLKKLFYGDDRLHGFILIGNVDKAGIYTALVRNRTPLSQIDFELTKKSPSLVAFGQDYRRKVLGGVV